MEFFQGGDDIFRPGSPSYRRREIFHHPALVAEGFPETAVLIPSAGDQEQDENQGQVWTTSFHYCFFSIFQPFYYSKRQIV